MTEKNKYKVLLVEDGKIAQQMASEILSQAHCDVDVAATGKEAVDLMKKRTYDMIFMDLGLPDIDGFTTTESIRKFERVQRFQKSTPIIALTAHEGSHVEITCRDNDMDDFLLKPLTEEKVLEMLQKHANR